MQASLISNCLSSEHSTTFHPHKEREFISPASTKFTAVFFWKFLFETMNTLDEDCEPWIDKKFQNATIPSLKQLAI
jgi:hypothetical protein